MNVSKQFREQQDRAEFERWKARQPQRQLVVKFGPWVPKPVTPPLAPKAAALVVDTEAEPEEAEQPARVRKICNLVKLADDAARARDEILGL